MEGVMEHAMLVVVAVVALLLLLQHHQQVAAEGSSNSSDIVHGMLAQVTGHLQIIQFVREHKARCFSYCLCRESRDGFLRLDGEVTRMHPGMHMLHTQLIYNENHAADYGPYYFVELAGISLNGQMLAGIDAGTFRSGGTTLAVGTGGTTTLVHGAYAALERALEAHMRPMGLPRVNRLGYTFCLGGATHQAWHDIPLVVKLHFKEPGVELTFLSNKLFQQVGPDICLAMKPGDRTVLGAMAQVDTRFTFDLDRNLVYLRFEWCEHDTGA